jgi:hypothetical protein
MNRYLTTMIFAGLLIAAMAAACTSSTVTPTAAPAATPTQAPAATDIATAKPQPTAAPAQTPMPAPTSAPGSVPTTIPMPRPTMAPAGTASIPYLDDRSDAAAVIHSLFNAINLHQYARAYSYWDDTPERVAFDQFEAGYQDTASVQVTLGAIGLGAGAGNLYAPVPVTLSAKSTAGTTQTFVGCYLLHLGQPAIQGTLPFRPWGIQSAAVQPVADNADPADLMSHACDSYGQPPELPPQPTVDPGDISANQYIDNRTGPVEVLRSLYNAINRHEYLRAYSYWKSTAQTQSVPGLDQFEQGYSTTQAVTLTAGLVTPDAGAGQFYYTVPVTLKASLSDGTQQTFVGCYVLHISNPDIQAAPPFQPLGIESANVQQVANDADTASSMNQMCGMP